MRAIIAILIALVPTIRYGIAPPEPVSTDVAKELESLCFLTKADPKAVAREAAARGYAPSETTPASFQIQAPYRGKLVLGEHHLGAERSKMLGAIDLHECILTITKPAPQALETLRRWFNPVLSADEPWSSYVLTFEHPSYEPVGRIEGGPIMFEHPIPAASNTIKGYLNQHRIGLLIISAQANGDLRLYFGQAEKAKR